MNRPQKRTPEKIIAQQKNDAVSAKSSTLAASHQAPPPSVPAVLDSEAAIDRYLAETNEQAIIGRLGGFVKDVGFVYVDSDTPLPDAEYLAHADQYQCGWIKFNGPGQAPDKIMGPLFGTFVCPAREELGELDETQWPAGLDNEPKDPWQEQGLLVFKNMTTHEFITWNPCTRSQVRRLKRFIATYRNRYQDRGTLPIVKLVKGGYQHKKYGWISTPEIQIVGKAAADVGETVRDPMNDEIPF